MVKRRYDTMVVTSLDQAIDHFRRLATRNLKFLTEAEIEAWASAIAKSYVERGQIIIRTPLPTIGLRTLLVETSEELVDYITHDNEGAREALRGVLRALARPTPDSDGRPIGAQALSLVEPLIVCDSPVAVELFRQCLAYCEARSAIERTRTFG
jgi:hypothetical protein